MLNSIRGHIQTNATLQVVLRQLNKNNAHKFFLNRTFMIICFQSFPWQYTIYFLINNDNSLDDVKQSELQVTQVIIFLPEVNQLSENNFSINLWLRYRLLCTRYFGRRENYHKMAGVSQVMLELMEHLLSSPKESRALEDVERILPFFRTRTPVFHALSKGERLQL